MIENHILKNALLARIDMADDIFIDISKCGKATGIFSLNLLLYLFACMELDSVGVDKNCTISSIFEKMLTDVTAENLKPTFAYYTNLWKENAPDISFNTMAEKLGIADDREFNYYRSGQRPIPVKYLADIMANAGFVYLKILFWRNFINRFIVQNKANECSSLIKESLQNKYSAFDKIALMRFDEYKMASK